MTDEAPEYERTGNPEIPAWWWKKALPLLESDEAHLSSIAARASKIMGRRSVLGGDAITKFKRSIDPRGRTVGFTNALSDVLNIPRPFFTAPDEDTARKINLLVAGSFRSTPEIDGKQAAKLAAADHLAKQEQQAAVDQRHGISSIDEGTDRSRGARRPARRRT